jgi:hypothetical protein
MLRRYAIPAFVVWHLLAIIEGAIPPPTQYVYPPRSFPSPAGALVDSVTPLLDRLSAGVVPVVSVLKQSTAPIRPLARRYRRLGGLGQTWNMFSNPTRVDRYVRARYYIQMPQGRSWTATELISPAHREDRVRLFQSFRDSYRDKALNIAFRNFHEDRKEDAVRPDTRSTELPNDLAPIVRYFSRRFSRNLAGGERIVRVEVWYGTASTPPPGRPIDEARLRARLAVLQNYYDGPIEQRVRVPLIPPYHGGETEADIRWVLEYYEEM